MDDAWLFMMVGAIGARRIADDSERENHIEAASIDEGPGRCNSPNRLARGVRPNGSLRGRFLDPLRSRGRTRDREC